MIVQSNEAMLRGVGELGRCSVGSGATSCWLLRKNGFAHGFLREEMAVLHKRLVVASVVTHISKRHIDLLGLSRCFQLSF